MNFQEIDLTRIISVYVTQLIISGIFFIIVIKILRRNRNKGTLLLSGFYLCVAIALILNALYIPLNVNPLVCMLYYTLTYLILLSPVFLLVFNIALLKPNNSFSSKKISLIIVLYGILLFFLLLFPDGIVINAETNWRPEWSLSFFTITVLFMTIGIMIPLFISSFIIYKKFEEEYLKKRLRLYIIGLCCVVYSFYGMFIYAAFSDPLLRLIITIASPIVLVSGILFYFGIGKEIL